ncbi:topoisomerase II [Aeromicrobium phragmitis]|uniref:Topoisomerase II n=2 Tax=Aeromicrobium phragmitis TaxID=2478914 RepID=A0A3L8PSG3_9ACTN|nr:topoisomerase II [Aeromicrobium phragmitis]
MGRKSRRVKPKNARMPFVARTFEGLPHEGDWIALREFVPAAHAVVTLRDSDRPVRICSLLPGAGAGLVREDGEILVGLQVQHNYGDISRDIAHVIELALDAEPGRPIAMTDPGVGPRLQDLLAPDTSFDVTVEDSFFYWIDTDDTSDVSEPDTWETGADPAILSALEAANQNIAPTTKLDNAESAYVTQMGDRTYLRWILPHDESAVLTALARLHVAGADAIGDQTKLIGMFRAHGLLVPVWELLDVKAAAVDELMPDFSARLDEALADDSDLTAEIRSARQGLSTRQLTIR